MRHPILLLFAAAISGGGCVTSIGKGVDDFPVASSPAGVAMTVTLRSQDVIGGELLEVRDTALVLRRGPEVLLVPDEAIANARFQGGDMRMHSYPDEFRRQDLRLLSRYPSGITRGVMAALLSGSGKSEPTIVTR